MYPFRRILIPTDFSSASEWVFDDAVRIAGAANAEIVILHIRMTWEKDPSELRFKADPTLYQYVEQQELQRLLRRVKATNATVSARMVVKTGPDAGVEICRTAEEEKVDLIVIATHARHHVAHLLIGSTTVSVINDPPAPVLAIRYGIRKRAASFKRIVVPVHVKQSSRAALELASTIAAAEGGEVRLVTICHERDRTAAESLLADLASKTPGAAVKRDVIRGEDVEREVVRFAEKIAADAIFLNAHGHLGDAKSGIIRHAPTPVMVVPK